MTDRVTQTDGRGSSPLISNPRNQLRCRLRPPRHDQTVRDHRDRKPALFAKVFVLSRFYGSGGTKFSETLQRTKAFKVRARTKLLTERRRNRWGIRRRCATLWQTRIVRYIQVNGPYQNLGRLGSIAPTYNPSEHLDRLYLRDC
jgi:hypothetical protein